LCEFTKWNAYLENPGSQRWLEIRSKSKKSGGKANIFPVNNNLYLIDASGNLFCIDAMLGNPKWNLNNLYSNGIVFQSGPMNYFNTTKNRIVIVSTKLGKVSKEIELTDETKNEIITDLMVVGDKIF